MGLRQRVKNFLGFGKGQARQYAGAKGGRLTADWITAGTSADAEIQSSLARLRDRSRQMGRDTPYFAQIKRLIQVNVVGAHGMVLQMRVPRMRGGGMDERINNEVEIAWRRWCRADSCDVRGQRSFVGFQRLAAGSWADTGEYLFRIVRQPFGRDNRIPIALEEIEPDQLDLDYQGALQSPSNRWRMGIEINRWGRPVNYAVLTSHPGDYLTTGLSIGQRRHEIIPASDVIHGFLPDRAGQTRGVPIFAPVMTDAHQLDGYEEAAVIRARAAASQMGFITSPEGELIGDDVQDGQRVSDFEPGVFKYLRPGESVDIPQMNAPDAQLEMFVRQKVRRMASGVGISYAAISRDASQASYSSQRQEYLQDQDHWRVLQEILIEQLNQRVFEEWLPLAVLSGAVRISDFEVRTNRYFDAVSWQPRGWAWVDPKKEAEANVIEEQQGYNSKLKICASLGRDYEQILRDKAMEKQLESQYGVTMTAAEIVSGGEPDA